MSLVPSLLQAIVQLDGEALVMHAGDKPYVVSPTAEVDLATRGLTLDAVNGIVGQLLPTDRRKILDEFGAVQYELPAVPEFPGELFIVVAARGGDDLWVELRRKRAPQPRHNEPGEPPTETQPTSAVEPLNELPAEEAPAANKAVEVETEIELEVEELVEDDLTLPDSDRLWSARPALRPQSHEEDISNLVLPEASQLWSAEAAISREPTQSADLEVPERYELWPTDRPARAVTEPSIEPPLSLEGDSSQAPAEVPPPAPVEPAPVEAAAPPPPRRSPVQAAPVEAAPPPVPLVPPVRPVTAETPPPRPAPVEVPPSARPFEMPFGAAVEPPPPPPTWPVQAASVETQVRLPPSAPPVRPLAVETPPPPPPRPSPVQAAPVEAAPPPVPSGPPVRPVTAETPPPRPASVETSPPPLSAPPVPLTPAEAPPPRPAPIETAPSPPPPVRPTPVEAPSPPPAPPPPPRPAPVETAPLSPPRLAPVETALPEPPTRPAPVEAPPPPIPAYRPTPFEMPFGPALEPPPPAVVVPLARNPIREEHPVPPLADPTMSGLDRLLRLAAARGASTLYLASDSRPSVRVDGELQLLNGEPQLTARDVESLLLTLMPERSHEALRTGATTEWIVDIEDVGRVRCMSFRDHHGPGGVFRLMPTRSVSADQLGLPKAVQALAIEPEGLVLVAGPRSSGKRTLMSAFADLINRSRRDHVITIEREVNIVHQRGTSFISQREVRGNDEDMLAAARAALREDPDVLVIEDLRTAPLMRVALEAAMSGHLVIGGFSAHTAAAAIDRIIDLYAPEERQPVQFALADSLRGVIVQVLLKKNGGGRVAARELLLNTPAVASVIAEGKTSQLPMAIEGGRRYGMMPLNDALVGLVQQGIVDGREAYRYSTDRAGLVAALKRQGVDTSFVERLA